MIGARRLVAVGAALLGGCTQWITLFDGASDLDAAAEVDSARGTERGDLAAGDGRMSEREPVHLGGSGPDACAASLAAASLRQALCTCSVLDPKRGILTRAIDSSGGAVDPLRSASVASNRAVVISAPFNIGGALHAVDHLSAGNFFGTSTVQQALHVAGDVSLMSHLTVYGDAWIRDSVTFQGAGELEVSGKFHLQPGFPVPGEGGDRDGGVGMHPYADDYVDAGPQCDCDPGRVPVDTLVAAMADPLANDDTRAGLDAGSLKNVAAQQTIDLPAGHYYLSGIDTHADVTLAVHGPVALFVDGGVTLVGDLNVRLDAFAADAALDVVFTGDLNASSRTVGSYEHPARVRLWSSSTGQLTFNLGTTVSAAIHAPTAELYAAAGLTLRGAALLNSVALAGGQLDISFDRALLSGGKAACGTPVIHPLP